MFTASLLPGARARRPTGEAIEASLGAARPARIGVIPADRLWIEDDSALLPGFGVDQLVLDGSDAGDLAGEFGGLGAGRGARHLARERDHAGVGANGDLLRLGVLGESLLHLAGDVLVGHVDDSSLRGRDDLEVVRDHLDPFAPLAGLAGCRLRVLGIDLPAEVNHAVHAVDADLGTLDSSIGEQRDLGLGGQPGIAELRLGLGADALGLAFGVLERVVRWALRPDGWRHGEERGRRQRARAGDSWLTHAPGSLWPCRQIRPVRNRTMRTKSMIPTVPLGAHPHPRLDGQAVTAPSSASTTRINKIVPIMCPPSSRRATARVRKDATDMPRNPRRSYPRFGAGDSVTSTR